MAVCTCAVAVAGPEPLLLVAPRFWFCGAPHQLVVRVAYEVACVAYEAAYVACLQRLTDLQ